MTDARYGYRREDAVDSESDDDARAVACDGFFVGRHS